MCELVETCLIQLAMYVIPSVDAFQPIALTINKEFSVYCRPIG